MASAFALLWGTASVVASCAAVLAAQWLADSSVALWSAALYAVPSSMVFGLRRHWSSLLPSSSSSSYLFTAVIIFCFYSLWGSVCICWAVSRCCHDLVCLHVLSVVLSACLRSFHDSVRVSLISIHSRVDLLVSSACCQPLHVSRSL